MSSLNPDLLYDIAKKFIEDNDSEAVIRFALSGRQCFNAVKNAFASVTTFEIGWRYYAVGWKNSLCEFKFDFDDEPFLKSLLYLIGNSVRNLHVYYNDITVYQPIIDKIIAKKQLVKFSSTLDFVRGNFVQRLPEFSSTLKHIKIPISYMTPTFRDTFNLESLTVTNTDGSCVLHCCKTETLEIDYYFTGSLFDESAYSSQPSPYLSSINALVIHGVKFSIYPVLKVHDLNGIMKFFTSLESFKFSTSISKILDSRRQVNWRIIDNIRFFTSFVNKAPKVPSKTTYSFTIDDDKITLIDFQHICHGFEYDDSITDFYCFRRTLQSAGTQSTIFEVQFHQE